MRITVLQAANVGFDDRIILLGGVEFVDFGVHDIVASVSYSLQKLEEIDSSYGGLIERICIDQEYPIIRGQVLMHVFAGEPENCLPLVPLGLDTHHLSHTTPLPIAMFSHSFSYYGARVRGIVVYDYEVDALREVVFETLNQDVFLVVAEHQTAGDAVRMHGTRLWAGLILSSRVRDIHHVFSRRFVVATTWFRRQAGFRQFDR